MTRKRLLDEGAPLMAGKRKVQQNHGKRTKEGKTRTAVGHGSRPSGGFIPSVSLCRVGLLGGFAARTEATRQAIEAPAVATCP